MHPSGHSAGEITTAKCGDDFVLDDPLAQGIRQRALESVARGDPDVVTRLKNEENRAIVTGFSSYPPCLSDAGGIIRDGRIALHFRKDRDQNLVRALALELGELAIKLLRCRRVDEARIVVKMIFRCRRDALGPTQAEGEREKYDCPEKPR